MPFAIFEKNKNEKVAIASMTKMVAQIIILEQVEAGKIKWNDIVTVSENAVKSVPMGYVNANLQVGEKLTVDKIINSNNTYYKFDITLERIDGQVTTTLHTISPYS